jgi:fluoride exporter
MTPTAHCGCCALARDHILEDSAVLHKLVLLAVAGALGTLARYGLSGLVHRGGGTLFPWGTLAVNVLGCFLAGLLWSLFESRWPVTSETRTVVLVGFMGAFTTFSAYILETGAMVQSAEWLPALGNIALQNGLGFAALFTGAALARLL